MLTRQSNICVRARALDARGDGPPRASYVCTEGQVHRVQTIPAGGFITLVGNKQKCTLHVRKVLQRHLGKKKFLS